MFKYFKVKGNSMVPSIKNGQFVLVKDFEDYNPGEVVLIKSFDLGFLVKRISSKKNDLIRLRGDNPKLESSVCDQTFYKEDIYGKVITIINN